MLIFVGTQAGPHREKAEFSPECLKDGGLMWCKQDLGRKVYFESNVCILCEKEAANSTIQTYNWTL